MERIRGMAKKMDIQQRLIYKTVVVCALLYILKRAYI